MDLNKLKSFCVKGLNGQYTPKDGYLLMMDSTKELIHWFEETTDDSGEFVVINTGECDNDWHTVEGFDVDITVYIRSLTDNYMDMSGIAYD